MNAAINNMVNNAMGQITQELDKLLAELKGGIVHTRPNWTEKWQNFKNYWGDIWSQLQGNTPLRIQQQQQAWAKMSPQQQAQLAQQAKQAQQQPKKECVLPLYLNRALDEQFEKMQHCVLLIEAGGAAPVLPGIAFNPQPVKPVSGPWAGRAGSPVAQNQDQLAKTNQPQQETDPLAATDVDQVLGIFKSNVLTLFQTHLNNIAQSLSGTYNQMMGNMPNDLTKRLQDLQKRNDELEAYKKTQGDAVKANLARKKTTNTGSVPLDAFGDEEWNMSDLAHVVPDRVEKALMELKI
jgi:hypothetical protein